MKKKESIEEIHKLLHEMAYYLKDNNIEKCEYYLTIIDELLHKIIQK